MKTVFNKIVWISALALALAHCSHLIHLERAQNAFSRGAELENAARFDFGAVPPSAPSGHYSAALVEVEQALKDKSRLQRDSVFPTALALKALCLWKLNRYEGAQATAREALAEMKKYERAGIFMARDQTMMTALPGLIQIDRVNQQLHSDEWLKPASPEQLLDLYRKAVHDPDNPGAAQLEQALKTLESAQAVAQRNPEQQIYLMFSELAALKNWVDAVNLLDRHAKAAEREGRDAAELRRVTLSEFTHYQNNLCHKLKQLKEKLPNGERDPTFTYWAAILGYTSACT